MQADAGGLRRWTQRFAVSGALALVLSYPVLLLTDEPGVPVMLVVFGFVCPMIFGMAYLLLPPYIGQTLVDYRLPGVHFVLAAIGVGLLVVGTAATGADVVFAIGALAWALGVAVFVGALLATAVVGSQTAPGAGRASRDGSQRSSPLAPAMLVVAIGYLVVGTILLLGVAGIASDSIATLPQVLHLYLAGFGALLVFALGPRLQVGFYHVTPPRVLTDLILLSGAVGPSLVGITFWIQPWFRLGAALEVLAMAGYALSVVLVGVRTDRRRFGLIGIGLGALAGLLAVAVVAPLVVGTSLLSHPIVLHRRLVLWGFFPLTIVGYAFLFFPVPQGGFPGATRRWATTTIGLLAVGLLVHLLGILRESATLTQFGLLLSLSGAVGYLYFLVRRFYG